MADIDTTCPIKNISIDQGSSIEVSFAVTRNALPFDLTGYIVRAQVRRTYADTNSIINATLANGKLVWIYQIGGTFKLVLQEADTSTAGNPKVRFLPDEDAISAVYDVELVSSGNIVYKVCRGDFTILREVTR